MKYRPEDYIGLRVVSNPEADHGFEVIDSATGRPVGGVTDIKVERGFAQAPPHHPKPQTVTITLIGIPVSLDFPDWGTFVAQRQAAHAREQAAREQVEPLAPDAPGAVPLPPTGG